MNAVMIKTKNAETRVKLQTMRESFKQTFIEMDDAVDASINAVLQGQHVVQIGPPGTAKSMLSNMVTQCIEFAEIFKYLMTMFTTPDEITGPLDILALKKGVERYKTEKKLPEAHIVFLDEIFKGNSAVLNTLLMLMNERKMYIGGEMVAVPLWCLFGASNEIPEDQSLEAVKDRFLYWVWTGDITDSDNFEQYLQRSHVQDFTNWTPPVQVTFEELRAASHEALTTVRFTGEIRKKFVVLRDLLLEDGVRISNRRWQQALDAVKCYTWLDDEDRIFDQHLNILKHCLWQDNKERSIVALHVAHASRQTEQLIIDYVNDAQNAVNEILKLSDTDAIAERINELDEIKFELSRLHTKEAKKAMKEVERMKNEDAFEHLSEKRNY